MIVPHWLTQPQALLVEAGGAVVTEDEAPTLGADEAPVSVHVSCPRPLLAREERRVVLGADDVFLGQRAG